MLVATGAGASAGYSFGDWVIQLAPVVVSLSTLASAIWNAHNVKEAKNDPLKKAAAESLGANERIFNSLLTRFDSLTNLLQTAVQRSPGSP